MSLNRSDDGNKGDAPFSTVSKWQYVSTASLSRVIHRLHSIWLHCPNHIVPLLQYGLLPSSASKYVWLKFQKIQAVSLYRLLPSFTYSQRHHVSEQLQKTLKQWQKKNFTHGDISPRNILIKPNTNQIWFIDWILDLKSFQATPKYVNKNVFRGIHDLSTDAFAMGKIVEELIKPHRS